MFPTAKWPYNRSMQPKPPPPGRSTVESPPNRFERVALMDDWEHLADDELAAPPGKLKTELLPDNTKTLITKNDSPDVPYDHTVNPYRGCEHGCSYCYARPGHEYLGMDAGLDFEAKILIKYDAPKLLRQELCRPEWTGQPISMSGVTDCYQPAERQCQLTRGCLRVMLEARQPLQVVTKNALVVRDADLLTEMARHNLVQVNISITTLDAELARRLEPRTSTPAARLRAVERLAKLEVPIGVLIAPVIPGLNDHEIPAILKAVKEAGAGAAGFQLLRLPLAVAPIFMAWLQASCPLSRDKIESRIRSTRGGRLNDAEFGRRMSGSGPYAEGIRNTFRAFATKLNLTTPYPSLDSSQFRPPRETTGQQWLF